MTIENALKDIRTELDRAESKHKTWPKSWIHQAAILTEETGEVVKQALDNESGPIDDMQGYAYEVIQTAAVCLRILKNLPLEQL